MTRKDYVKLAEALLRTRPHECEDQYLGKMNTWRYVVREIADVCAADNPRFDRSKFYEACRRFSVRQSAF